MSSNSLIEDKINPNNIKLDIPSILADYRVKETQIKQDNIIKIKDNSKLYKELTPWLINSQYHHYFKNKDIGLLAKLIEPIPITSYLNILFKSVLACSTTLTDYILNINRRH